MSLPGLKTFGLSYASTGVPQYMDYISHIDADPVSGEIYTWGRGSTFFRSPPVYDGHGIGRDPSGPNGEGLPILGVDGGCFAYKKPVWASMDLSGVISTATGGFSAGFPSRSYDWCEYLLAIDFSGNVIALRASADYSGGAYLNAHTDARVYQPDGTFVASWAISEAITAVAAADDVNQLVYYVASPNLVDFSIGFSFQGNAVNSYFGAPGTLPGYVNWPVKLQWYGGRVWLFDLGDTDMPTPFPHEPIYGTRAQAFNPPNTAFVWSGSAWSYSQPGLYHAFGCPERTYPGQYWALDRCLCGDPALSMIVSAVNGEGNGTAVYSACHWWGPLGAPPPPLPPPGGESPNLIRELVMFTKFCDLVACYWAPDPITAIGAVWVSINQGTPVKAFDLPAEPIALGIAENPGTGDWWIAYEDTTCNVFYSKSQNCGRTWT